MAQNRNDLFERSAELFRQYQHRIIRELEDLDGSGRFSMDPWTRQGTVGVQEGGGVSGVLQNGRVFEKAGVNFSEVSGALPADLCARMGVGEGEHPFRATGVSLVIHPLSPFVPTVHANYRFLEVGPFAWFGGGSDLTPYYLFEEDAVHFHSVLREGCERHRPGLYAEAKTACDSYFYLPHRGECRGVGGIFFDYVGKTEPHLLEETLLLCRELLERFTVSYVPIVRQREVLPWGERERQFQLYRRGRYVEFNLIHDRGTLFGLRTGGRTESILMSLPPLVRWEYGYEPDADSREAQLMAVLRSPRVWIEDDIP